MSEEKTPEQLLSEALRAKAVQAPAQARAEQQQESLFAGQDASFELLSGQDYRLSPELFGEAEPRTASSTRAARNPEPHRSAPPLSVRWILVLAVLLGAASGAVAGLLTLR